MVLKGGRFGYPFLFRIVIDKGIESTMLVFLLYL